LVSLGAKSDKDRCDIFSSSPSVAGFRLAVCVNRGNSRWPDTPFNKLDSEDSTT
jgi:hypothetical protein